MNIKELIKQLKEISDELEKIEEKEPDVDIDIDVGWEYWIDWFWDIEKTDYWYQIKCEYSC